MSADRILAVDITSLINEAVKANIDGNNPLTYGEILFALRVCAAVIINDLPEEKRAAYVQSHMIGTAEMLGVPLIPMEVDMPSKERLNCAPSKSWRATFAGPSSPARSRME